MNSSQAQKIEQNEQFLLKGGLLHLIMTKFGLDQADMPGIKKRISWLIVLTYAPLLVLSCIQGVALNQHLAQPFLTDIAEISRFFLVGPLLLFAEVFIEPWLTQVMQYARDRLIAPADLPIYKNIVVNAIKWRDSYIAEILLFLGTFLWQWIDVQTASTVASSWHHVPSSGTPSYAWYFYAYFAKPLIRFLWLRWLWRYLIWGILLCRLACIKLKVIPTHPDRLGGLAFIAAGHTKFAILAFTFGVQAASILGQQIIFGGKTLMSFQYDILAFVVVILILFLTPLLSFTAKLMEAKRAGLFEYGALADQYTTEFRDKWIISAKDTEQLLGTADIQSLADMDNAYQVVREMKTNLINKDTIMVFALSTLIPFMPLLLTVYPFDELLRQLLRKFF